MNLDCSPISLFQLVSTPATTTDLITRISSNLKMSRAYVPPCYGRIHFLLAEMCFPLFEMSSLIFLHLINIH